MSLSAGSGKLNHCLKELRRRWEDAKAHWNDSVSQGFEDSHIAPLEMQLLATLREIDRLAQSIDQAHRDCG